MKIGVTAGNFDIIHPGYLQLFDQMRLLSDQVIVLLQTDPTVERPEKLKPIVPLENRLGLLKSLKQIDRVETYTTEQDLYDLLVAIQPTYRFLGDDYRGRSFTGDDLNIDILWVNRDHGWSTTKFKQLIAQSYEESSNS